MSNQASVCPREGSLFFFLCLFLDALPIIAPSRASSRAKIGRVFFSTLVIAELKSAKILNIENSNELLIIRPITSI